MIKGGGEDFDERGASLHSYFSYSAEMAHKECVAFVW